MEEEFNSTSFDKNIEIVDDDLLDIAKIVDIEKLENIQRSLSKTTGLAFVTVDFRGEPITETTFLTNFCSEIRKNDAAKSRCKASDAFGAIQATVTKETSIYFCPCGLLEVAIPIVFNGQYLGGFIGGQVRCEDAPEYVNKLSNAIKSSEAEKFANSYKSEFDSIPIYEYEKFRDIANLVSLVVNELLKNVIVQKEQEKKTRKYLKKIQSSNARYAKQIKEKDILIDELKLLLNPYQVIDMLSTVLNSTVIENSKESTKLLETFLEYYKYYNINTDSYVSISNELEQIGRYIEILQKKYGDKIEVNIQVPKNMNIKKIPSKILMPFIKNAIYNGALLKEGKVVISVDGFIRDNNLIFEISDNGPGISQNQINAKYAIFKDNTERHFIKSGMDFARIKMENLFGDDFFINIETDKNIGQKCIIVWPELYK